MAQAKKKTATRTAKKTTVKRKTGSKSYMQYQKYDRNQKSNVIFVACMSALAATLLFANMIFMVV